jgi:arginase
MAQPKVIIHQVPTEAGTHFPGQCKAPARIVNNAEHGTGLLRSLDAFGYDVVVLPSLLKSLPPEVTAWQPSSHFTGARNEDNALKVCKAIYDGLNALEAETYDWPDQDDFEIFLGGDCSITPAILAGLHKRAAKKTTDAPKIGVLYMDGDVDLTLPRSSNQCSQDGSTLILDSMVMTHLTQRPGGCESMKLFSKPDGTPLVDPTNIVLFGFDPLQPSPEHFAFLLDNGYKCFSRPTVRRDPVAAAKSALAWLKERCDVIVLHFDVDVIDSAEFPLANYPHYAGLHQAETWKVLKVFLAEDDVKAMIVTEVNPNNDPEGWMVTELVGGITQGFKERLALKPLQ